MAFAGETAAPTSPMLPSRTMTAGTSLIARRQQPAAPSTVSQNDRIAPAIPDDNTVRPRASWATGTEPTNAHRRHVEEQLSALYMSMERAERMARHLVIVRWHVSWQGLYDTHVQHVTWRRQEEMEWDELMKAFISGKRDAEEAFRRRLDEEEERRRRETMWQWIKRKVLGRGEAVGVSEAGAKPT